MVSGDDAQRYLGGETAMSRRSLKSVRGFGREMRGTAAIELALTLPLFLGAIFFVVEFGRVLYSRVELQNAVYYAARFAMVSTQASKDGIIKAMEDRFVVLSPENVKSVDFKQTVNADKTKNAELTVTYDVFFAVPIFSKSVTLTRTIKFLRSS